MLQYCFCFMFFLGFRPQDMCNLSSLARNQTGTSTLEGRVLTTGPPGKFLGSSFNVETKWVFLNHPFKKSHRGTSCVSLLDSPTPRSAGNWFQVQITHHCFPRISSGPSQPFHILHLMELTDHVENYPQRAVKESCMESYRTSQGTTAVWGGGAEQKALQSCATESAPSPVVMSSPLRFNSVCWLFKKLPAFM